MLFKASDNERTRSIPRPVVTGLNDRRTLNTLTLAGDIENGCVGLVF